MVSRITGNMLQLGGIEGRHVNDAQFGFRQRRRAEDEVTLAMRIMEDGSRCATNVARMLGRVGTPGHTRVRRVQLSMLDMEKAYPNVITSHLYGELMEMGWGATGVDVSKKLQGERESAARWRGGQSDGYMQEKGPQARCPTSRQLFLLYHMSALEQWRKARRPKNARN